MNDAVIDDDDKKKRFRSPPYPMFDLKKAVERARLLYSKAQTYAVGVNVIADAWGMKSGDGKVWRAAAALIHYGLLVDSRTGKTRKFQLTDIAKRIILDQDPESPRLKEALQAAALAPMIHKELWDRYKTTRGLADTVLRNYLTLDREEAGDAPYSPGAAAEVLATYRATLAYAGIADSDTVEPPTEVKDDEKANDGSLENFVKIEVGDFVKWTSGGIDQFKARKVEWISEDGSHLRVIGSGTGIPMKEVEKVDGGTMAAAASAAVIKPTIPVAYANTAPEQQSGHTNKEKLNVTTSVVGQRLQLSADVSAEEIDALKDILTKYQEILKMMN